MGVGVHEAMYLSLRLLNDDDAIAGAIGKACNRLLSETGRIT